jgi:hypothetical protein
MTDGNIRRTFIGYNSQVVPDTTIDVHQPENVTTDGRLERASSSTLGQLSPTPRLVSGSIAVAILKSHPVKLSSFYTVRTKKIRT